MLIASKTTPPQPTLPLIHRQALLDKLDHLPDGGLAFINAPAGFGKTTLISQWQKPFTYLSLAEDDNEPWQFFCYFRAALYQALNQTLPPLTAQPVGFDIYKALQHLLAECTPAHTKITLVLDNFQHIHHSQIIRGLDFWLRYQGEMRLVILSRHQCPLALSPLRLQEKLLCITQQDLAFSLSETEQFCYDRSLDFTPPPPTNRSMASGLTGLGCRAKINLTRPSK